MWNEVYVEESILGNTQVTSILKKINKDPIIIDKYDDIWGRSKKPYLHKRDSLNLFLATKKGQLLKQAPEAYGQLGEPHYYFIHAYNCIYECQYCYLQGYFNTPDIVIFVNHDEIIQEMQKCLDNHPEGKVWFHAGEFSDSLALTHLTGELKLYHEFCKKNPRAYIELRTKSVNTKELDLLEPLDNLIVSFSLSPKEIAKRVDLKTPSVEARIRVMKSLIDKGFSIAAHFDPIIYEDHFKQTYSDLLKELENLHITHQLLYLSLGVVRFTKDVYREVERNYPESILHTANFVKSFDNKVRYSRPMRMWMMNVIKDLAINCGIKEERIYLCMEEYD
ncbi:MAG: radical SAM protein [Bacteriovoracaceae bacterium]